METPSTYDAKTNSKKSNTTKKAIELKKRRSRVLELRRSGCSLEAISAVIVTEFGIPSYNRSRAYEDIQATLKELSAETSLNAEQYRTLELERLDNWQSTLQSQIEAGNTRAIDTAVKIRDRRCNLLGINAPIQLMVTERADAIVDKELKTFMIAVKELISESAYGELMDAVERLSKN